jgi:aryl carrier-like protein
MSEMPQSTPESHDALWVGLPSSNVFKQKKLTGLREDGDAPHGGAAPERRVTTLDADRYTGLRAYLAAKGLDFHVAMLGAYHLALQWYLDDVESLIGCCVVGSSSTIVRASYVYAEDEDPVEQLLGEIERQFRNGRSLPIAAGGPASWDAKRAPVFFYAGLDGTGAIADLDLTRVPERRVVLVAGADAERAEFALSMPAGVSDAMAIDEFQQRFDAVLRSLLTGGHATVGELRSQLGAAADVPYRQLDEMQRRVIELWARVLGIPETALDASSSYFEVGGTSLNAFKLVNRVRIEFQRDISIRDIIEHSTIQEFSRLLLRD